MRAKAASRRFLCLYAAIGAVLFAGAGCDSVQPDQLTAQMFSMNVRATISNTSVTTFNTYTMFRDNDADSQPDDVDADGSPDTWLWCKTTTTQTLTPNSVPWPYLIEVRIVRQGSTSTELITTFAASQTPASFANADTSPAIVGSIPTQAPIVSGPDTYRFTPRNRTSALRADVLAATSNPLSDNNAATYPFGAGRCSTMQVPIGLVDGAPAPFMLEIEKGDTVVVTARKAESSALEGTAINVGAQPALQAEISLDGRPLTSVSGSTVSSPGIGGSFNFSFTSL